MPEIDKYIISKILFFIFGSTTVIIFFLFYTGVFINIVGSIEAAIMIYCINTALLIPVTIWYAIERSHKPKYKESDILEAYSEMISQTDDESAAKETTKRQWKKARHNKRAIPNNLYGSILRPISDLFWDKSQMILAVPHTRVAHTLANPFYYGHFRYLSEIHEGKHKGIISKQLFDRVQTVLERRGKPTR